MAYRILIFEDNTRLRQSLELLLGDEQHFTVAASFPDCDAAAEMVAEYEADLVVMDIKIVENETENGTRRFSLFASTSDVRFERKLNRDVKISSKLTATLVPVPMPLRLEPVVTTTPAPEG